MAPPTAGRVQQVAEQLVAVQTAVPVEVQPVTAVPEAASEQLAAAPEAAWVLQATELAAILVAAAAVEQGLLLSLDQPVEAEWPSSAPP